MKPIPFKLEALSVAVIREIISPSTILKVRQLLMLVLGQNK